jgi:hypothetical protein
MRYLFAVMAVLMILFALVQYDDPDGALWMVLYGVPAIWAGLAWWRPHLLVGTPLLVLLAASLLVALALVVALWPPDEGWWRIEVWWESEESREGMGLMIGAAVLLAVFSRSLQLRMQSTRRKNPPQPAG